MAPEVQEEVRYAKPADIWSLGLLAHQLPTNVIPFKGSFDDVINLPTPPLPGRFSEEYQHFIVACLEKDPSRRATAEQLLRHDFLASINDQTFEQRRQEWKRELESLGI